MNSKIILLTVLLIAGVQFNLVAESESIEEELVRNFELGGHSFNPSWNYENRIKPVFEKYGIDSEEKKAEILYGIYETKYKLFEDYASPRGIQILAINYLRYVDTPLTKDYFKKILQLSEDLGHQFNIRP